MGRGQSQSKPQSTRQQTRRGLPPVNSNQLQLAGQTIQLPLAHGTSLDSLASIIENGLGAKGSNVEKELKGRVFYSVCDLRHRSGLLGAYCFAVGQGSIDKKQRQKFLQNTSKTDPVKRYTQTLGYSKMKEFLAEKALRVTAKKYQGLFGERKEAPALLIYEGAQFRGSTLEENAPSAYTLTGQTLDADRLRAVLVPQSRIKEAEAELAGMNVSLYPLELVEGGQTTLSGQGLAKLLGNKSTLDC
jgi:hypothetical protein